MAQTTYEQRLAAARSMRTILRNTGLQLDCYSARDDQGLNKACNGHDFAIDVYYTKENIDIINEIQCTKVFNPYNNGQNLVRLQFDIRS